ncbi:hypothetical protein F5148DRAFT_1225947 [Russula earlei]|uniref:Uncharacterized protein n=1 Tax=Russula earlei TaxID=71964 RepID=A0ACC0U0L2_9AGAM|nr:hypothetical protein F5148DRAFT_1225947 [Russula earlei]
MHISHPFVIFCLTVLPSSLAAPGLLTKIHRYFNPEEMPGLPLPNDGRKTRQDKIQALHDWHAVYHKPHVPGYDPNMYVWNGNEDGWLTREDAEVYAFPYHNNNLYEQVLLAKQSRLQSKHS